MGNKKNGWKPDPEYYAWHSMRGRVYDKWRPCYANYSGRGISICERWASLQNFREDMGPRPGPEYSLDRIDNDGNYEPGNCRWATAKQQTHNRRNARKFMIGGKERRQMDLCAEFGVNYGTVNTRLRKGYSIEFALMPCDLFKVLTT